VSITLLEWRRRVRELYAAVRAEPDPRLAWQQWRRGRDDLFATHPDSPVRPEAFRPLRFFPYDPAFRFSAVVEPASPGAFEVATTTDGVVPFSRIGRVRLANATHDLGRLDVWWLESYGGGVFVPFRDATAASAGGHETYGAGRYLLDTVKGADLGGTGDALVLDLNFAYNPSCAYDPAWVCPLPPAGNHLDGRVTAGEQTWQPSGDVPEPERRNSDRE
jgi:uncharacterized protein (DUF1684 family)